MVGFLLNTIYSGTFHYFSLSHYSLGFEKAEESSQDYLSYRSSLRPFKGDSPEELSWRLGMRQFEKGGHFFPK